MTTRRDRDDPGASRPAALEAVRLHLTQGDPTGVGPELLARALVGWNGPPPVIHAHQVVLERLRELGIPVPGRDLPATVQEPAGPPDPFGAPGLAQRLALEQAVAHCRAGRVDALVTAPVDKARLAETGFVHPGHTGYLAAEAGVPVVMMFVAPSLRVVPATVHLPLAKVPKVLAEALLSAVVITTGSLVRDFGLSHPRVAVAGLNPHAGEGGLLGTEERQVMRPALRRARQRLRQAGIEAEVSDPLPGDTVFRQTCQGRWDAVVAAYHDQALIPVKLLAFDQAVNFTAGLPYVRTSPAHGTAADLAWSGQADASSMRAALDLAVSLARRRIRAEKK